MVEADLANTTVIPQRAVVSDTLPTEEPQPGPSSAPDIIPEVQLRTARVMTREDNQRQLDKFNIVMLEKDQLIEFEELYKRGIRDECSDALWKSWLPLKIEAEKEEIIFEADVQVYDNLQECVHIL